MPVPSDISELSQTAGSNNPPGSESPITTDDYLRTYAAFIAVLRDGKGLSAEVDVASAGTCDIGAANTHFVRITGTTTITSFGTNYNGPRFIRFGGALTLTHNASTLVLPGAANITTVAGDCCLVIPIAAGWVVHSYTRASGREVIGALTTVTAVGASGTSIDFTGIPSWVSRITLLLGGISTTGTDNLLVQLGDSGGVETALYAGAGSNAFNGASPAVTNYTAGFGFPVASAAAVLYGSVVIERVNVSTNFWVARGVMAVDSSPNMLTMAGGKALSAPLDRVRLTTTGGTNTFDTGAVNILYE